MRYKSLGWLVVGAWIGAWPAAAHADHLSNARASLKKGDLKAAQIELRNAVRADPQNAEAHFWLGRVTFDLGDPVAAEREANAARDRGHDPRQTVALLSQALLAQNKFDQLLASLPAPGPDGRDPLLDASVLVSRGYALIGLKRPDEARQAFAQAERLAPDSVGPLLADARLAFARADLAAAQGKIDRALALQPKSPEALLARAQLLRMQNNPSSALAVLDGLVAEQPGIVQARLDRASLELAAGSNDAALADVGVVLKAAPGNVQAIYLRAVAAAQAKDYGAADADLERISGFLGRIQRAYYLQAVVKEQLGQGEQAEDAARKYLGRAPEDLAAYKVLARIELARRRPDQAVDTLGKLPAPGGDAETFDLLGRAYAMTGQGPAAVAAFQKAEALAPGDVGLQTRLASVRLGMGDPDAAVGDLEHTLALAPSLPAVGEALFFAALATGDAAKAADALGKIRSAEGDTAVVGNLDGLYKLSQIDLGGARAAFSDVAQGHPDFVPARINLARVLLMQGDKVRAEGILTDILAKQPAAEPALTMLASVCLQSGRVPDATALLERAHRSDPALTRVTVALGDLYVRSAEAQKAMELASAVKAPVPADILGLRAAALLALGQKQQATETYAQILRQDPNASGARRQLIALLAGAGDFEAARNAATAGIAAAPRDYQLYQDFVLIDLKAGGIDAALATAARLQGQDRDFAALRALKGDAFMAAGRPLDAAAAYNEANGAAPSVLLLTREAGAMARAGQADAARALLADWVGGHPGDLAATEQLANVDIAGARWDDAVKYLEEVLRQKPHDAAALNNLAWVYQQKGDDARAQPLAHQAYVLSPGAQTADTLGWILTTSGDAGNGVALLRQASETGSDPRIAYHYAVALRDTGNREEAKKALQAVVAAKGDFKEKAEARKMLDDLSKGG